MKNKDNPSKEITPGRHSGRQKGGKRGLPNPQSIAAQGVALGRHWVDGGCRHPCPLSLNLRKGSVIPGSNPILLRGIKNQKICCQTISAERRPVSAPVQPCVGREAAGQNPYPTKVLQPAWGLCERCVAQTAATAKSALSQGTAEAEGILLENRQDFFCAWMEKSASRERPSLCPWARPLLRNRPFDFSTRIKEVVAGRPPPRHFCPQCGQCQGVAGLSLPRWQVVVFICCRRSRWSSAKERPLAQGV